MLSWIHSSPDKCMASPWTREKNLPLHPGPSPYAPAGSAGSDSPSWRQWQLRITAVACLQSAGSKPSSNPAAPFVGKMVCARRHKAGGILLCPSLSWRTMYSLTISLAILLSCSWRPSSCSRVPGGQGWIVVEFFPPCCRLQQCSIMLNLEQTVSDTSKMQVTIEEAQGAQSNKEFPFWKKYCRMERNIVILVSPVERNIVITWSYRNLAASIIMVNTKSKFSIIQIKAQMVPYSINLVALSEMSTLSRRWTWRGGAGMLRPRSRPTESHACANL